MKLSKIPKLKIIKLKNFSNPDLIITDIKNIFKIIVAVRSSHLNEDGNKFSNVGRYLSFLNLNTKNGEEKKKINLLIYSYKKNYKKNIFFIQEMVQNIKISGVVLTKDINNYLDCYVINYHRGYDSTVVTSGKKTSKSIRFLKNKKFFLKRPFDKLVMSINEIEKKFKFPLDIEFIIDKKDIVYVVQIRKLNIPNNKDKNTLKLRNAMQQLEKKIVKLQKPHYNLFGKNNFFGVMPDWNPAEIIGKKPRPLALSLYQELITNHVWSKNRTIMGIKI